MLILFILVFGLFAGWLAEIILGRRHTNYAEAFVVGIAGSFLGGLIVSLLSGDGLALRPSGLVGSVLGAVVLLAIVDGAGRGRRRSARPR